MEGLETKTDNLDLTLVPHPLLGPGSLLWGFVGPVVSTFLLAPGTLQSSSLLRTWTDRTEGWVRVVVGVKVVVENPERKKVVHHSGVLVSLESRMHKG